MKRLMLSVLMALVPLMVCAHDPEEISDEQTYVVFWTNQNVTGKIAVYYNGNLAGYITKYYSGVPKCGAAGCVTVSVRGKGNTWSAVGEDGTIWYSERVTLKPGCNAVRLYRSSSARTNNRTTTGSSGSSKNSGVTGKEKQVTANSASSLGTAAGVLLATALSQGPGWDKYAHRLDIGIGCGYGYGGLGVKLNYQSPVVFGATVGLGVSGPEGRPCWNLGLQMWPTDHWNMEIGLGSRYYRGYGDYMVGVIMATNYQYPITERFGVLGGLGFSLSTNSDPYVRMEFNLGIVMRLLSR